MRGAFTPKRAALYGIITALALILSYIEFLIPFSVAVPGIKIGLANIAAVFAIYKLGARPAWVISLARVLLAALLFGNVMTLFYSVAGAVLSLSVMIIMKKAAKMTPLGVSVAGGVSHNVGQIMCAVVLLGTRQIIYYLPVLILSGTVAGAAIGVISGLIISRIKYPGGEGSG